MSTWGYLVGRLSGLVVALLVVSVLVFALMRAVPGGPFDETKMPLPPAAKANILHKYGLDRPWWTQYGLYVWHAVHGDFGVPYESPTETVVGLIARVWPVTMVLGAIVIVLSFSMGFGVGIFTATRQGTWLDSLMTLLITLGIAVPNFVVAIWLIVVFAARLHWFPTGGWGDWQLVVLPAAAYSLQPMAVVARYTRVTTIEALSGDYVRTAEAKGLNPRYILLRHVLRNALVPLITLLGPWIPELFTGSIFIEVTFRIPGLGRFFATSVFQRDYPMIMAIMLLVALLWGTTYLCSDLLYHAIDPRVRLSARN
jgi:ABC-type dipeptide/oligopeptide/nickel transport system permease component